MLCIFIAPTPAGGPSFHRLVEPYGNRGHYAGNGCADLAGQCRVGFRLGRFLHLQAAIAHGDFAGLAVQFEEDRAGAVGVRFADGLELHDQRLAGFQFDGDIRAALHPVVKLRRRKNFDVPRTLSARGHTCPAEVIRPHARGAGGAG